MLSAENMEEYECATPLKVNALNVAAPWLLEMSVEDKTDECSRIIICVA